MAEVPLVREPSVQPSGEKPGFQQVQYSPDAFGAGIGRALGQLAGQLQNSAEIERHLRSDIKANDAFNAGVKAEDDLRPWLWDPNDGIFAKKGGDALGTGQQAQTILDDIQKKYIEQIKDPETQQAFRKLWLAKSEQVKDQVARHEFAELGQYKTDTVKGVVASSMQSAYDTFNDPKAIDKAIADTRRAIRANTAGQPAELTAAAEADAVSNIHLAVISRYAAEDPSAGLDYYQKHKDEIHGKDHVTATEFLQPAIQLRRAHENAARITGAGEAAHNLYTAVESAESGFHPQAVSPAGALGLMQVMPDTARGVARSLGMTDVANLSEEELKHRLLHDTELNRTLGRTYLNQQLRRYNGDIEAALVAYNAGPRGADDFLKHNAGRAPGQRDYNVPGRSKIKSETEPYVKKIMTNMGIGVIAPPDSPAAANGSGYGGPGGTGIARGAPGAFYANVDAPAYDQWLAAAQNIVDPGERAQTIAQLNLINNQQKSAIDAQIAADKTNAWETVIHGGVKDIDPQLLARLDPAIVNSMYSYEANRAKGGGVQTDWKTYTRVINQDDEGLRATDPYDYRDKLADEEYKKLVDLVRAAHKAKEGDASSQHLMANMRSRGEIFEQSMKAFELNNSLDAARVEQFSKQFDRHIQLEQAAKGGEIDAVQMQDIMDKLLLQDQRSYGILGKLRGAETGGETENPDSFVAASSWDEVQKDDQDTLIKTYQQYQGKAPDKETATDLYNRAFRVYLGGKPSGPDDEQKLVRSALSSALGRQLSDSDFERYYGRWLLKFLGR